jgi:hypothetical protein
MNKYFFLDSSIRNFINSISKKRKIIKILCNDRFELFIHQQCNSLLGIYNNVQFVTKGDCDLIIVINKFDFIEKYVNLGIPIYLWMIEPPDYLKLYIQDEKLHFYDKIFTCSQLENIPLEKQIITPPFVHWHHAYNSKSRFIKNGYLPFYNVFDFNFSNEKVEKIFLLDSHINNIPGHQERIDFIDSLSDFNLINLYGSTKWSHHHRYKSELPSFKFNIQKKYKYSLIIENQKDKIYWSEKITDTFLALSFPIYYGSSSISEYFPNNSYIELPKLYKNYLHFEQYFLEMKSSLSIDKLIESRNLVLHDYNLLNVLSKLI